MLHDVINQEDLSKKKKSHYLNPGIYICSVVQGTWNQSNGHYSVILTIILNHTFFKVQTYRKRQGLKFWPRSMQITEVFGFSQLSPGLHLILVGSTSFCWNWLYMLLFMMSMILTKTNFQPCFHLFI